MLGTLSKQEAEELLYNNLTGRIGCYANGKVYVVPISYVFDGTSIIAHSREGMKIQFMRSHPDVCQSVHDQPSFIPSFNPRRVVACHALVQVMLSVHLT